MEFRLFREMFVEHFEKSPGDVRFDVFREWWIEPGDSPFPVALSFGSFFLVLNLLCVPAVLQSLLIIWSCFLKYFFVAGNFR